METDVVARRERRRRWNAQQSVLWFRIMATLVDLLLRFWVRRYVVVGRENVPDEGGAFMVANHTTFMDPLLVGYAAAHRIPSGPGKTDIFVNPILGYLMRRLGIFPLRQGMADGRAVRTMVGLYREGRIVIVFPEGTRSRSGEMGDFSPEFTRLLIKLHAPAIPAAVAGGSQLMPIGSPFPRPNVPVAIVVGEAFDLSEFYGQKLDKDTLERATEVLRNRVEQQLVRARLLRSELQTRR